MTKRGCISSPAYVVALCLLFYFVASSSFLACPPREIMYQEILLVFYHILKAGVLFFIPYEWRSKKILEDDIILVTGAGSGLGREFALSFAKRGARKLVLLDISESGLNETADLVKQVFSSTSVTSYVVDVTKRSLVYATADKVRNEVGLVTYLINNAGIVSGSPILTTPDEKIIRTFELIKSFLPGMIEHNRGHVVTIASLAGHLGIARLVDYVSSKHAAVGTHRALRAELLAGGSDGVHCTCICPFFIDTGMFAGVRTGPIFSFLKPQSVVEESVRAILANRDIVFLPPVKGFLVSLAAMVPIQATDALVSAFQLATSMNTFVGRSGSGSGRKK